MPVRLYSHAPQRRIVLPEKAIGAKTISAISKVIKVLELAFGSGMDHLCNTVGLYIPGGRGSFLREVRLFEVSFFAQAVVLALALSGDEYAELEWAFASAHAAWFLVLCFNRSCVRGNPFNAMAIEEARPRRAARVGVAAYIVA